MSYLNFVDKLDAGTIQKLNTAVEIGKWESGDKLTDEQRSSAMEAVMLWNAKNNSKAVSEPFVVNAKGEFKIGKGESLSDIPLEHKTTHSADLIFKSKN